MNPQYSCRIDFREMKIHHCNFTMPPVYLQSLASYPW